MDYFYLAKIYFTHSTKKLQRFIKIHNETGWNNQKTKLNNILYNLIFNITTKLYIYSFQIN